jgi:hypothetical protein
LGRVGRFAGIVLALLLALPFAPKGVSAIDGVNEINHACALVGCFSGDPNGYPVVIKTPGSYRLTGHLDSPDIATSAIEIETNGVVLDLGGFSIRGVAGCATAVACASGAGAGIEVTGGLGDRVRVTNGTVQGFGAEGILLGEDAQVDSVVVSNGAGVGIKLGGGGVLQGNRVSAVLGIGLSMDSATLFSNNSVFDFASGGGAGASISSGTEAGTNYCYDALCPTPVAASMVRRRFYMTTSSYDGKNAANPGNCAAGFHFAGLYEIFDPSLLQYDHSLGVTGEDAGEGPIAGVTHLAWVRTGEIMSTTGTEGEANCDAWSSVGGDGSGAYLGEFGLVGQTSAPWRAFINDCSFSFAIWCVED